MGTYLYCVLRRADVPNPPTGLTGIDGVPVRSLAIGDLAAWVSTAQSDPAPSPEHVRIHNDVIEAAMGLGFTPLPARFGQRFDDDDRCATDLESRAPALRVALARVTRMVEMGILLVPVGAAAADASNGGRIDATSPGAGRRYLSALRDQERERERWQELVTQHVQAIEAALGELVHGSDATEPSRGVAGGVAHLVCRGSESRYREVVGSQPAPPGIRVVTTGPRAPYSFAGAALGSNGTILAD